MCRLPRLVHCQSGFQTGLQSCHEGPEYCHLRRGWWLLPRLWRDRTLGQGLMWPEVRIRRAIDLWHGNTRCCRFHWLGWLFFSVTVVLGILVETLIPFRWWHFLCVVSYPKYLSDFPLDSYFSSAFCMKVCYDALLVVPFFQGLTKSSQLVLLHHQLWWNRSTAMLLKKSPGGSHFSSFFWYTFLGSVFSFNSTNRDLANSFGMGKMPMSELVLSVIRFYHLWDFEKDTQKFFIDW